MSKQQNGWMGWAGVAVGVGLWDTFGGQTMTESFQNALDHPVKRYIALGGMAVTCAHLLDLIPHQVDPFHILASNVGKVATNLRGVEDATS